jgi:CO/xanthine dehydrogenase FAD-binding subunit
MAINHYHRATSIEDAHQTWRKDPSNILLGGGLWSKKSKTPIATAVDLVDLHLDQIIDHGHHLEVGAMVSLRDFEQNPLIQSLADGCLAHAVRAIMGVGLRRLATVGGSIAAKLPFSDLITPLLALDATLLFYPQKEMRLEDFLNQRGKSTDILTHILIKKTPSHGFFKKVANTSLDFAILNVAVVCDPLGYTVAVGARPGVAVLAKQAMDYLAQFPHPGLPEFAKAADIVAESVPFLTTSTASESYRQTLARTYVRRGLEEVANCES